MDILHISNNNREWWNSYVSSSAFFSLTQSYEWGEYKEKLGWIAIRIAIIEKGNIVGCAQMLLKKFPLGMGSLAYIPRGPLLDWNNEEVLRTLLEALHLEARRHKAVFLRIEPPLLHSPENHLKLRKSGFQISPQNHQPRCSIIMDLDSDLENLFSNLPKKTRKHIRSAERKNIIFRQREEGDVKVFYELMQMTSKRSSFEIRSFEFYEQFFNVFLQNKKAELILADYQGETIAAECPVFFGKHGAALYGASANTYRKIPVSDLITWEGIKWAKEQGCQSYDLYGIPDEIGELIAAGKPIPTDKKGGLWGVFYFKKGFSGEIVYYVGGYDYVYSKPSYIFTTKVITFLQSRGWISHAIS